MSLKRAEEARESREKTQMKNSASDFSGSAFSFQVSAFRICRI
jgi:hypothetical protein